MPLLCITGDFNAGKSTVRRLLEHQGWYGIDCDQIVHDLYRPGQPGALLVRTLCGQSVFFRNGRVNRHALAKRLRQPLLRHMLEHRLHPLVKKEVCRVLRRHHTQRVCVEVPVYHPKIWHNFFDGVLWVTARSSIVRARLPLRKKELTFLLHIKKQPPGAFVIYNTKGRFFLKLQIQQALVSLGFHQ